MQLFAKFKKNLRRGFRATLIFLFKFENPGVILEYREIERGLFKIFDCAKLHHAHMNVVLRSNKNTNGETEN